MVSERHGLRQGLVEVQANRSIVSPLHVHDPVLEAAFAETDADLGDRLENARRRACGHVRVWGLSVDRGSTRARDVTTQAHRCLPNEACRRPPPTVPDPRRYQGLTQEVRDTTRENARARVRVRGVSLWLLNTLLWFDFCSNPKCSGT